MIELNGKHYLTVKEASKKYGYSVSWFRNSKNKPNSPPCCQKGQKGKVLYPLDETDQWFQDKFNMS